VATRAMAFRAQSRQLILNGVVLALLHRGIPDLDAMRSSPGCTVHIRSLEFEVC